MSTFLFKWKYTTNGVYFFIIYYFIFSLLQGKYLTLHGVSSDATRMKFSTNGQYLILTDAKTRSVLQFRVQFPPS